MRNGTQEAQKAKELDRLPYILCVLCFLCSVSLIAQESRTTWDGVYNEAQAKRGEAVYAAACSNCHGPNLEGADMTPPLTGGVFTANWDGLTVGDLADRIRVSMPFDRPGTLGRQDNADIVAYILRFNQFPAGNDELPRDIPSMKQITFKASKP